MANCVGTSCSIYYKKITERCEDDTKMPPDTTPPPSDPNLNPPIDPVEPDDK